MSKHKRCRNCGHQIRRIGGVWKHRREHSKYSGVVSGGVTFSVTCRIRDTSYTDCGCQSPQPVDDARADAARSRWFFRVMDGLDKDFPRSKSP